jgi:hypothetical protein
MKIALISTTINAPRVLALYRAFGPEVEIIVTGDLKTPQDEVRALLKPLDVRYLDPKEQEKLGHASSEAIGWNSVQRRNIALLEALRTGADVIVTVDDDNIPMSADYFDVFAKLLSTPFNGLCVKTATNWFDVGELLQPVAPHRGFPVSRRRVDQDAMYEGAVGKTIGIAAGLWFGDPDTDAMTRIVEQPNITQVSEALRAGLLVAPGCFTPFNSQNTGYRAEIAPLMAMWTGVGRYDDIWASYFTERVMMESGHHLHFGQPFVWQQRNQHDLMRDLQQEAHGDTHTERFVADLLAADLGKGSVVEMMRRAFDAVVMKDYVPEPMRQLVPAWCKDIERVSA